jgi:hypothetical protein
MIRNNDMFINLRNPVDIIQHSTQDGIFTYLQQWLWEVLRQLSQPSGVPRRYYNTFHIYLLYFTTDDSD